MDDYEMQILWLLILFMYEMWHYGFIKANTTGKHDKANKTYR